jgi:ribonucleotide reductase alpha subunit
MRNILYLLFFIPLFAFGQASTQDSTTAKKSMFVKVDTTLVVKQELSVSKLETKKTEATKKREKWLGTLVKIIRDVIKGNQIQ